MQAESVQPTAQRALQPRSAPRFALLRELLGQPAGLIGTVIVGVVLVGLAAALFSPATESAIVAWGGDVERAGGPTLPEVVGPDDGCGLLVPPGDIDALTAALARVLGSTAERDRLGAAGRARATERFSWTAVARATEVAYHEALAVTGGRPC